MSYEIFDPVRHKVELREVGLSTDRSGVHEVNLASIKDRHPDAEYPCAMRSLIPGEHEIGWGDKLRIVPEDVAMCVVNGNALIQGAFFPLLFDHGFTARGTESPGDVLECYEEGGAFWQLCDLADEEAYKGICKPGKRWKNRSLSFGAWYDGDGFLRPVQPKELSVTNLPRLKGLGPVVEMSHLRKALGIGFGPGPAGLVIPITLAAAPPVAPEGPQTTPAGSGGSLPLSSASPATASNRKEEHMKVTPETLKLLGLAENASEDEFNAAVAAKLAPKPDAPATKAEPETPAPALALSDVQKMIDEATARNFAAMAEQSAKAQVETTLAAAKKARVDTVLSKAVSLGRMTKADVELYRPAVEANPDGFEARLSTMPKVAPVDTIFEKGDDGGKLSGGSPQEAKTETLTYASQYARLHNIGIPEAQRRIAAAGAN
ncbi:MAG: phage protease [Pseudomonadota bacterium]|nr:phage protease [Pseudomonadota bacterium]